MNHLLWAAIREYVQAEVRLGVAELRYADWPDANKAQHLEPLREQVTRCETEVRRMTDLAQERIARIESNANEAQSHHVRY